ncbi:hypothetical protein PENSTE_c005G07799 [Penicillium steckii]|uniref:Uncharacterized protein n=1 Tax=Penicillium steckii TaxID=303698 RepID=A0A1V6TKB2_9EURO|nr:hypothetical protein PENSTE_c005G07799 [Penicillium steckii]
MVYRWYLDIHPSHQGTDGSKRGTSAGDYLRGPRDRTGSFIMA